MLKKIIQAILGDPNEKVIAEYRRKVEAINQMEKELQGLTDEQVKAKTVEFRKRLEEGEHLDQIVLEALAVHKNACRRLAGTKYMVRGHELMWDMVPYDVQLIGAMILNDGKIAEMKTGEGKTLVASISLYLNSLFGKGAYLVTVNDYLAQRDAEWMQLVFQFLGVSVGVIKHGQSHEEKKKAYECDVTYGTNNEFGFDYLRDNMATDPDEVVQRELHYAIVDEVDSILIDEARTPLIISAAAEQSTDKYKKYAQLVRQLEAGKDYTLDEKAKACLLSDEGIKKMEGFLGMENIYTEAGFTEVHHIEQSLKAHAIFKRDVDYMVNEGEVLIVDEFTGRLMPGRRFSEGLHQAIEAKEGVEVKRESKTLATVTFQNYFRLFRKLAGMTGTALTEAEEFSSIYRLETLVVPTNVQVVRDDKNDLIYKTLLGKFKAVAKLVKELQEKGQPVLVGTVSVEKSEVLSKMFQQEGVKHSVLNAKYHEKEAEIVSQAGQKGVVTIATNMAGRGTDIKLGEGVKELGGLAIVGTERHEARRIDNQLRGRSGRQGDPGYSQFYASMEDDLMRLFGGDRMKGIMETMKVPEDMSIENAFISKSIESAQKKVEGMNFDIRKHLVEYDDVMNRHREIIYGRRRKILNHENLHEDVVAMMKEYIELIVDNFCGGESNADWNYDGLLQTLEPIFGQTAESFLSELRTVTSSDELKEKILQFTTMLYDEKKINVGNDDHFFSQEKHVYLRTIDRLWMEHIDEMMKLREQVSMRGYGQKDPLIEYKREAFEMFEDLISRIQRNTVHTLLRMEFRIAVPETRVVEMKTNEEDITESETGSREMFPSSSVTGIDRQPSVNVTVDERQTAGEDGVRVIKVNPVATQNMGSAAQTLNDSPKPDVGRNDPCPCGSGKKYKKCCMV